MDTSEDKIAAMEKIFSEQKSAFRKNPMPDADARIRHLEQLKKALLKNRERMVRAIDADFSCRARDETLMAELLPSVEGIRYARRRVRRWMKPRRRRMNPLFLPGRARLIYQPLGVVGIVVPWNYPLFLAAGPLTGALAAGNRVMIKMSEYTPQISAVFQEIMAHAFRSDHVHVVTGEAEVAAVFSELPWDHLLFTGSTAVGRRVMSAAAKNLTPVTLEMGGKSPAIVGPDIPVADAAERIAFGKLLNAGQTCIAPDYVLCPEAEVAPFLEAFRKSAVSMYPSMDANRDYTAMVSDKHYKRISALLDDAREKGARVDVINPEGEALSSGRKMPLYLVRDVKDEMAVMQEEIFGPILPVIGYRDLSEAVSRVNEKARPLVVYYFGYDRRNASRVLTETSSGGAVVNDTLIHVTQDDLPFGGVGESGMGRYHGEEGFITFSNPRSIVYKPRLNSMKLVYPPYGRLLHRLIYRIFLQ